MLFKIGLSREIKQRFLQNLFITNKLYLSLLYKIVIMVKLSQFDKASS